MFYSATITLVPLVTLVLHGLLPLHPLYNIHVLLHNTYDTVVEIFVCTYNSVCVCACVCVCGGGGGEQITNRMV